MHRVNRQDGSAAPPRSPFYVTVWESADSNAHPSTFLHSGPSLRNLRALGPEKATRPALDRPCARAVVYRPVN
jgi:hypothetical protein